jgi:hypothetical protein
VLGDLDRKGLEAAAITWDDGPNGKVSNADIVKQLEEEAKPAHCHARVRSLPRLINDPVPAPGENSHGVR